MYLCMSVCLCVYMSDLCEALILHSALKIIDSSNLSVCEGIVLEPHSCRAAFQNNGLVSPVN